MMPDKMPEKSLNSEKWITFSKLMLDNDEQKIDLKNRILQQISVDAICESTPAETCLHLAVREKNTSAVKFLLEKGASVDKPSSSGYTSLQLAIIAKNHKIAELLLANGANPNVITKLPNVIHTPLILAINFKSMPIIELLLSKNADPNLVIEKEMVTLSAIRTLPAKSNDLDVFKLLINHPNTNRPNYLEALVVNDKIKLIEILLESDKKLVNHECIGRILHHCASKGNLSILQLLAGYDVSLSTDDDKKRSPLQSAIVNGHEKIIDFIMKNKKINITMECYYFIKERIESEKRKISNNVDLPKIIKLFLKNGASITQLVSKNSISKNLTIFSFLLNEKRMDILKDIFSCAEIKADTELILHDENPKNSTIITPLNFAVMLPNLDLVNMLLNKEKGQTTNSHQEKKINPVDCGTENKATSLVYACILGNSKIVERLIYYNADVNLKKDETTPLEIAICRGDADIVNILLNAGANLDVYESESSPQSLEIKEKNEGIAEILCQHRKKNSQNHGIEVSQSQLPSLPSQSIYSDKKDQKSGYAYLKEMGFPVEHIRKMRMPDQAPELSKEGKNDNKMFNNNSISPITWLNGRISSDMQGIIQITTTSGKIFSYLDKTNLKKQGCKNIKKFAELQDKFCAKKKEQGIVNFKNKGKTAEANVILNDKNRIEKVELKYKIKPQSKHEGNARAYGFPIPSDYGNNMLIIFPFFSNKAHNSNLVEEKFQGDKVTEINLPKLKHK